MSHPVPWRFAHGLCIASHIGMWLASFAAFAGTDVGMKESFDASTYIHVAPWGAGIVAMIGIAFNIGLFAKLSQLDTPNQNETMEKRHLQRQTTIAIGVVVSLCLVVADIAMAFILANASRLLKYSSTAPLNSACFISVVSAILTGAMVLMDLRKLTEWSNEMHEVGSLLDDVERNNELDDPYRD